MRAITRVLAGSLAAALLLAGCGSGGGDSTKTLYVAMPEVGKELTQYWDAVADEFKAANPGWDVEYTYQADDMYSTVGLTNLLTGKNPPDVFFEWAGNRVQTRYADGYAADLTDKLAEAGIADRFVDGAFNGTEVDGKRVLVPQAKDIANVIWYNKATFDEMGLQEPTTWAELDALNTKLAAAGITPYAQGNKDLWPAGNWGAHIIARVAGEGPYNDAMLMKAPMNSPEMVAGMQKVAEIARNGWINDSVNSISDNEGYTLFFQGKSAMTPIGNWMIDVRNDQAPDFAMDWFNLPAVDGGAGDQSSVIGVATGMVGNAKSPKMDQVVSFFDAMTNDAMAKLYVEAGNTSLLKAGAASTTDPLAQSLADLNGSTSTIVAPPDTGYNLKVADILNTATSQVIGGAASPQQALDEAQQKVEALG